MVQSLLNPEVNYPDIKNVDEADLQYDASVYDTEILGKNVEIVIGKEKKENDVSYFYTYVVLKSGKMRPIGVYEIKTNKIGEYIDGDGDIEIDKLDGPLLYPLVVLIDFLNPM